MTEINWHQQGRGEDLWAPGQNETWALGPGKASCDRYAGGAPI